MTTTTVGFLKCPVLYFPRHLVKAPKTKISSLSQLITSYKFNKRRHTSVFQFMIGTVLTLCKVFHLIYSFQSQTNLYTVCVFISKVQSRDINL